MSFTPRSNSRGALPLRPARHLCDAPTVPRVHASAQADCRPRVRRSRFVLNPFSNLFALASPKRSRVHACCREQRLCDLAQTRRCPLLPDGQGARLLEQWWRQDRVRHQVPAGPRLRGVPARHLPESLPPDAARRRRVLRHGSDRGRRPAAHRRRGRRRRLPQLAHRSERDGARPASERLWQISKVRTVGPLRNH